MHILLVLLLFHYPCGHYAKRRYRALLTDSHHSPATRGMFVKSSESWQGTRRISTMMWVTRFGILCEKMRGMFSWMNRGMCVEEQSLFVTRSGVEAGNSLGMRWKGSEQ